MGLFEFEASLLYIVSRRTARAMRRDSVSKNKTTNKNKRKGGEEERETDRERVWGEELILVETVKLFFATAPLKAGSNCIPA